MLSNLIVLVPFILHMILGSLAFVMTTPGNETTTPAPNDANLTTTQGLSQHYLLWTGEPGLEDYIDSTISAAQRELIAFPKVGSQFWSLSISEQQRQEIVSKFPHVSSACPAT